MVKTEEVRKELSHFPHGASWKVLADELHVGRTTIYEALHDLADEGQAYNQDRLWFPIQSIKEASVKPSIVSKERIATLWRDFEEIKWLVSIDHCSVAYKKAEPLCLGFPSSYQKKIMPTFTQGKIELGKIRGKWLDPTERSRAEVRFYRVAMPYIIQRLSETLYEIEKEVE